MRRATASRTKLWTVYSDGVLILVYVVAAELVLALVYRSFHPHDPVVLGVANRLFVAGGAPILR